MAQLRSSAWAALWAVKGKMTERAALKGVSGTWAVSVDSVNTLIEDLARPTTEVARVITAVAEGTMSFTEDGSEEIEGTPVKGEFLASVRR